MPGSKLRIQLTPAFCIGLAFSLFTLPFNFVLSWLLAMFVHELCHYLAVLISGGRVYQIRLTLFGAQMTADSLSYGKEIFCALAGPVSSGLLIFLRSAMPIAAICGCVHAIANLIPMQSLDGGKVLYNLLCMIKGEKKAENICVLVNKTLGVVILMTALYISWRLSWGALAFIASILFYVKNRKNPLANKTCYGYNNANRI